MQSLAYSTTKAGVFAELGNIRLKIENIFYQMTKTP